MGQSLDSESSPQAPWNLQGEVNCQLTCSFSHRHFNSEAGNAPITVKIKTRENSLIQVFLHDLCERIQNSKMLLWLRIWAFFANIFPLYEMEINTASRASLRCTPGSWELTSRVKNSVKVPPLPHTPFCILWLLTMPDTDGSSANSCYTVCSRNADKKKKLCMFSRDNIFPRYF